MAWSERSFSDWYGSTDASGSLQPELRYSEFAGFNEAEEEVFPGCPQVRNGYAYLNDKPGIGVDFDEKAAAKYPAIDMDFSWLFSRLEDGTAVRP